MDAAHHPPTARRPSGPTLYRRLFVAYAAVLAVAVSILIFAPVTISVPIAATELVGVLLAFGVMLLIYRVLLHRALNPLERLTELMRRVDPLAPGERIRIDAADREVVALTEAFNGMLDRLEGERRDSARRALAAQEGERRRIARELHDEIGQVLTGLVLRAETLSRRAPDELRANLEDLREAARHGAEDVRRIARRLRPEALDELGLQSALLALCTAVSQRTGLEIARELQRDLALTEEQELVVYRVAQESITNTVRHSGAKRMTLTLRSDAGVVVLELSDDGVGFVAADHLDANGLRGMRERALLIGAHLEVSSAPGRGTAVRLRVPVREPAA